MSLPPPARAARFAAPLFALLLVDCSSTGGDPPPRAGVPGGCSEVGCVDGFTVAFSPDSGWQPGTYRFIVDVDGEVTTCEGALPLGACDAGPSLKCTPASDRVSIGESGCALPPDQHGFSGLTVGASDLERVSVTIGRDTENLVQKTFTPTFTTSQPNGAGCDPTCSSASDALTIPGAAR